MIYQGNISNFLPYIICVGCHIKHEGDVLYLQKPPHHKYYPSKWGVVAGKVSTEDPRKPERLIDAMVREILEETGWQIDPLLLKTCGVKPVKHPHLNFLYHWFRLDLHHRRPQIKLSAEHVDYRWVTPQAALSLDLIEDEEHILRYTYPTIN